MKHHQAVHIVTRKHLSEAMEEYPHAADEIKAWMAIVGGVRWHNFPEVRSTFKDADNVKGYVIFDFRRNRYRLCHSHSLCENDKHKEYDNPPNWDRKFGKK